MKKKRKILIGSFIIVIVVAALLCCGIYLLHFRYDILYAINETLFVNRERVTVTETAYPNEQLKSYNAEDVIANNTDIDYNQSMMLINNHHLIEDDYDFEISEFRETELYVNSCAVEALDNMLIDVSEHSSEKVYISSAYRSADRQAEIVDEEPAVAAVVGASEHQSGLCVDLYCTNKGQHLFIKTDAAQWIYNNCRDYGFILRYPFQKERVTEIPYEVWHFRYVGLPHSKIIYGDRITYDEYIESMKENVFYSADGYVFGRINIDENGCFLIPDDITDISISPDNTGLYVFTGKVN